MSNPIKQHYVPQLYLKNFTFDNDSKRIYVKSKTPQKLFSANIRNTAAEKDFYTLSNLEEKYLLENYFAKKIEPQLGVLLKKICAFPENVLLQNHARIISAEEKYILSFNIMIQLLRSTNTRKFEKQILQGIIPRILESAKEEYGPLSDNIHKKINTIINDPAFSKEIALSANFDGNRIIKYTDLLQNKIFLFYSIVGNETFVTSDNPVVFINSVTLDATPFKNGLADRNTVILYPISPKMIVAAYHPYKYFGMISNMDCCITYVDSKKEKMFIKNINIAQKESCLNFLYSNSKEQLVNL